MNQRTWPGLHMQFKEIHTDTALTTNRESGLDSTARRIHIGIAPMTNGELD
jgi:hypothetical protein